jgi:putative endonuclease
MYKVYLLRSHLDNTYYIGQTSNIKLRLAYHNTGRVKSTNRKKPWILIGYEEYKIQNKARWREHQLKHNAYERYKFINKLLNKRR